LREAARGREYIHRSQAAAVWLLLDHLRENGTLPVPEVEFDYADSKPRPKPRSSVFAELYAH